MAHRWIIEYLPGCKGDLLTTVLNKMPVIIDEKTRATNNIDSELYSVNRTKETTIEISKFDESLSKISLTFINQHSSDFLYKKQYQESLLKHNFGIKKLIFSPKYYITISLENIFKNYFKSPERRDAKILEKYNLVNDYNRIKFFYELIKNHQINCELNFKKYKFFNKNFKSNFNKDLIDYESLYINFNCGDTEINENINWENFKQLVDKSWLPNKMDVFGETFDLIKMGYRQY